jgi:hypothetical protein
MREPPPPSQQQPFLIGRTAPQGRCSRLTPTPAAGRWGTSGRHCERWCWHSPPRGFSRPGGGGSGCQPAGCLSPQQHCVLFPVPRCGHRRLPLLAAPAPGPSPQRHRLPPPPGVGGGGCVGGSGERGRRLGGDEGIGYWWRQRASSDACPGPVVAAAPAPVVGCAAAGYRRRRRRR